LMAYNFAGKLKTLRGLTPIPVPLPILAEIPSSVYHQPFHHTVELNILSSGRAQIGPGLQPCDSLGVLNVATNC
jgi:hypothetical protein